MCVAINIFFLSMLICCICVPILLRTFLHRSSVLDITGKFVRQKDEFPSEWNLRLACCCCMSLNKCFSQPRGSGSLLALTSYKNAVNLNEKLWRNFELYPPILRLSDVKYTLFVSSPSGLSSWNFKSRCNLSTWWARLNLMRRVRQALVLTRVMSVVQLLFIVINNDFWLF